jgi:hypothetical protein
MPAEEQLPQLVPAYRVFELESYARENTLSESFENVVQLFAELVGHCQISPFSKPTNIIP